METETPRQKEDGRYLIVRSGGFCCALPATMVRQVVRGLSCYPVPGSQPYLRGLAQFAGEPLAVLDLHALIAGSLPGAAHRATVILGRGDEGAKRVLGLAVDEAVAVTSLSCDECDQESGSLVAASTEVDGDPVKVLDPSVLFSDEWNPGVGGSNG